MKKNRREKYVFSSYRVRLIIEQKGFMGAFHYIGPKGMYFEDPELGDLWDKTVKDLADLRQHLYAGE